jgi:hypothetical protein
MLNNNINVITKHSHVITVQSVYSFIAVSLVLFACPAVSSTNTHHNMLHITVTAVGRTLLVLVTLQQNDVTLQR